MAESQLKRQREEHECSYDIQGYECEQEDYSKRHKSYNDILSILEQEEDEPNQDLSDIFTIFQQELSSSDSTAVDHSSGVGCCGSGSGSGSEAESADKTCGSGAPDRATTSSGAASFNEGIEEDERVRVMRHLLEASDDELGIPNRVEESGEEETDSGEQQQLFLSGDWKWQFEDDAANYYTFMQLQSELFI